MTDHVLLIEEEVPGLETHFLYMSSEEDLALAHARRILEEATLWTTPLKLSVVHVTSSGERCVWEWTSQPTPRSFPRVPSSAGHAPPPFLTLEDFVGSAGKSYPSPLETYTALFKTSSPLELSPSSLAGDFESPSSRTTSEGYARLSSEPDTHFPPSPRRRR